MDFKPFDNTHDHCLYIDETYENIISNITAM